QHADRRPDGIHIRHLMTHNDDIVAVLHQVAQRMRHDAGAYARTLLHGVRLAAVERLATADTDGRLVAAPAECDVERGLHPLADLKDAAAAGGHADAERHWNALIHRHLAHFI